MSKPLWLEVVEYKSEEIPQHQPENIIKSDNIKTIVGDFFNIRKSLTSSTFWQTNKSTNQPNGSTRLHWEWSQPRGRYSIPTYQEEIDSIVSILRSMSKK